FYDKIILRLPVFGKFFRKVYLVQFAENLSVLMRAGLPITQAISITRDIVDNTVYKDILKEAEDRVSKGEKMSVVLEEKNKDVFPFVTQMVATGEETGRLDSVLIDVVNFYSAEIERTAANLTTLLEPFLILSLGVGIGVLAVAIFVPLFKIGMGGELMD
ncbi:type II secretion system F family protein, partial [Candidatus Gribaldobacteria bacterium]|nr:type II secretion system F family protein [Candidatus Gribaldobacteria bacterium]